MIRRSIWACTLIGALLFVLPASASSTSADRSPTVTALQPGPRPGTGLQPAPLPDPVPTSGGEPGDDDTPNRNGTGGVDTPSRDTINAGDGRKFWMMKDLSAWLQRHVMYILRANR